MYTVGQSISLCPLLVSGAAQLFRSPLPDVQLAFHRVPLHRSPGSGQEVTCFQSSNDRHRSNRSSIHRHLISVAILHGVFQEIIVEFRKKRKLVEGKRREMLQSDACGGICHQAAAAFWTDTKYPRYSLEQERASGMLFIFCGS